MSIHPELLAERFRRQASAAKISPERLLLQELNSMNQNYLAALTLLEKEG